MTGSLWIVFVPVFLGNVGWAQGSHAIDRLGASEWARRQMPSPVSPSASSLASVQEAIDRAKKTRDQMDEERENYLVLDREYRALENHAIWEIRKFWRKLELGMDRRAQAGKLKKAAADTERAFKRAIQEASGAFGIGIEKNAEKLVGERLMRTVVDWDPRYSECEKIDPFGKCRKIPHHEEVAKNLKVYAYTNYRKNGEVVLFRNAFDDPGTLGSFIYHEMFHWVNLAARSGAEPGPAEDFRSEQIAFELQAKTASNFGKVDKKYDWEVRSRVYGQRYKASRGKSWEWVRRNHPDWIPIGYATEVLNGGSDEDIEAIRARAAMAFQQGLERDARALIEEDARRKKEGEAKRKEEEFQRRVREMIEEAKRRDQASAERKRLEKRLAELIPAACSDDYNAQVEISETLREMKRAPTTYPGRVYGIGEIVPCEEWLFNKLLTAKDAGGEDLYFLLVRESLEEYRIFVERQKTRQPVSTPPRPVPEARKKPEPAPRRPPVVVTPVPRKQKDEVPSRIPMPSSPW